MPKISADEVKRIAVLARIGVTDEEAASLSVELGQIVEFVEQLQNVDTKDLPETNQVTGLVDVWREDEVKPSAVSQKDLLKNAPMTEDGYIKVHRVL